MHDLKTIVDRTFNFTQVEKTLIAAALFAGGVATPYSQGKNISHVLGDKGVCHGLSISWLATKHRYFRLDPRSAFAVTASRYWDRNLRMMQKIVNRSEAQYKLDQNAFNGMLNTVGLQVIGTPQNFYEPFSPHQGVAKATWHMCRIRLSPANRYYLFSVPKHAMAVTVSTTSARFFDPNGGEVVFNSPLLLLPFLQYYLLNSFIKKGYFPGGVDITIIEVG